MLIVMLGWLMVRLASAGEIAGWIEWASLENYHIDFKAKLDTGAKHSSINANELELIEKDGEQYVRFKVTNEAGQTAVIEKPVVRTARVKRHFNVIQERPVIILKICIGGVSKETEVNLVDRAGLNYQLLIGRSFLDSDLLIDSARTYIFKHACD